MNSQQEIVKSDTSPVSVAPQIIINLNTSVPFMHPFNFANDAGLSAGVVGGWIDNGYLPTVKVGRYQMINLVLLTENLKKGFVL